MYKGKGKDKRPVSRLRLYRKTLVQDNYWCVSPGDDGEILWFIEGEPWTPDLTGVLDNCIGRISYFGRSESLTEFRRIESPSAEPNCELLESPVSGAVPVLVPQRDAVRGDIERVTEDPLAARNIPQGARVMYARRPPRPPVGETPRQRPTRTECNLIQLALGWAVAPEPRAVVRLTARFRSAVLSELIRIKTAGKTRSWNAAPVSVRSEIAEMIGKDAQGTPLSGPHRHTEFFAWGEGPAPTRLLIWRHPRPFDEDEQSATLQASSNEISWAAAGGDADAWKIKLIPLDAAVPPPRGFDNMPYSRWISLTPYVPPRHHLRSGKPRAAESIESQIRRELASRGVPGADTVEIKELGSRDWVAVHIPRREVANRMFLGDRLGYRLEMRFAKPVIGPLRLGHSASFGLGLFVPVA
jgi:CRISPR-associated protein Csb2